MTDFNYEREILKQKELINELLWTPPPNADAFAQLLFKVCNIDEIYTQVGDGVDYGFIEDRIGHVLYIFFEPSDGLDDWRNNFSYWRKPYKDMEMPYRVHGGFLKCWKTIDKVVIDKVMERRGTGAYMWDKVIVVGYSHGGALAALCHEAVWFHREDLRNKCGALQGYGFEAPRIYAGWKMNRELAKRWAAFTVYRNKNDVVTHLPPIVMGFRHVGNIKWMGRHNKCGPIDAHRRAWVRKGLGEDIDVEKELEIENALTAEKKARKRACKKKKS